MTSKPIEQISERINEWISPLGFELVYLETLTQKQKVLRLYVDRSAGNGISLDDCATVSHAIDEKLDALPEIDQVFGGPYDLEVSSPGVERPLRKMRDFERFKGERVRIHTFRPLTPQELGDATYAAAIPKQKNFIGTLAGAQGEQILLTPGKETLTIPLALVSKAHLETDFNYTEGKKRGNPK